MDIKTMMVDGVTIDKMSKTKLEQVIREAKKILYVKKIEPDFPSHDYAEDIIHLNELGILAWNREEIDIKTPLVVSAKYTVNATGGWAPTYHLESSTYVSSDMNNILFEEGKNIPEVLKLIKNCEDKVTKYNKFFDFICRRHNKKEFEVVDDLHKYRQFVAASSRR